MIKGGVDSFQIIAELFQRHPEPTREQAREISPALFDVYERLMRVRVVAPTVTLQDRTWKLMELVGIKRSEPIQKSRG